MKSLDRLCRAPFARLRSGGVARRPITAGAILPGDTIARRSKPFSNSRSSSLTRARIGGSGRPTFGRFRIYCRSLLAQKWAVACLSLFALGEAAHASVTVVDVVARSAASRADIRVGDVLEAWRWSTDDAWRNIDSPFDLDLIEVERASTDGFLLRLNRGDLVLDVEVDSGVLDIAAVPGQDASVPGRSRSFLSLGVDDQLTALAAQAARSSGIEAAWYWSEYAEISIRHKRFAEGRSAFAKALAAIPKAADRLTELKSWTGQKTGEAFWRAGDYRNADKFIEAGATLDQSTRLRKLLHARAQHLKGRHAAYRGDYDSAQSLLQEARGIQSTVAPSSMSLADTVHDLGNTAFWGGEIETAERWFQESLEIREALAAESDRHARSLAQLGNVFWRKGDLETAETLFQRARDIHEVTQPGSLILAGDITMLGHVASDRNDFAAADRYYYQSLAITQNRYPGEVTVANTLMGIANILRKRVDLDRAREFHKMALELYTKSGSKQRRSLSLSNLGNVELDAGNLEEAQRYYEESLAIRRDIGIASGSLLGSIYYNLGRLEHRRGRSVEAQEWLEKALAEYVAESPESLAVQAVLFHLGEVKSAAGRVPEAAPYYERSLNIASRLAPGTMTEVESLHRSGVVAYRLGDKDLARKQLNAAVAAFEMQRRRVGGNGAAQRHFTGQFEFVYEDLAELLIRSGEYEAAFDVMERFRSRVLSAMISGRLGELQPNSSVSISDDLARASKEYDTALAQLMRSGGVAETDYRERRDRLDRARRNREFLEARYAALMPRRASIEQPEPLPLRQVAGRFNDDVAILSYAVSVKGVDVFAVSAGPDFDLEFVRLDVDPRSLGASIDGFLDLMQLADPNDPLRESALLQSEALYQSLIQPVAHLLSGNRKIIILPDGALYRLPFAALGRRSSGATVPRFLVQDHEILYAPSLHWLLSSSGADSRSTGHGDVLVFADPRPHVEGTWPDLLSQLYRGERLPSLPAARREAQIIADLFEGKATVYVGDDASELRFKQSVSTGRYGIQHFATHAISSSARPMESFLVLAADASKGDADENGLLQAREIAEGAPIDAQLVVLAACHTAPDADDLSDSVNGLTGAFLYAGARNVLATYWPIRDEPTSGFMGRYYEQLRDGALPGAALREVQMQSIRRTFGLPSEQARGAAGQAHDVTGRLSENPLAWAAFAVYGDGHRSVLR